jgi:hypothetical protein
MRLSDSERALYGAPRFDDFYGTGNDRVARYVAERTTARSASIEAATYRPNYFAGIVREAAR